MRIQLAGIGAFLLALGSARAWLTLLFAVPALPASIDVNAHHVFDVLYFLVSLGIALGASRFAPLCSKPWVRPGIIACMLGASILSCGAALLETAALPLAFAGAVLGGTGFALFLLIWAETLSRLSLAKIALFTAASQFFGVVLVFFCTGLEQTRLIAALVILPLVTVAATSHALRHTEYVCPEPNRAPSEATGSIPWKLIALMGVISLAYGLREQQLASGAGMYSGISTGIAMLLFGGAVYCFSDRISLSALSKSTPLLMLCGFLLIPAEGILGLVLSSYMISIGYSIMSLMVALMLYDISKRFGIAIIALMGFKNAMQIFVVFGNQIDTLLDTFGLSASMQNLLITAAVVLLVFLAAFILYSEKELTSAWGVKFIEAESLTEEGLKRKRLIQRCDELSRAHKLSPREDEILRLYAQGMNGPSIERELFIAEGTLKTHTRHIYEKLGVANRKGLYEALGIDPQ